jgi:hypothetical protein
MKKIPTIPQEAWDTSHLRYWQESGEWLCAVPRDDIATKNGFSWKKYGLIGRGKTAPEAMKDWQSWKRCSDLVADIY